MSELTQTAAHDDQEQEQKRAPKKRSSMLVLWGGALALLALLGWGLTQISAERPSAGQPAPDIALEFFDGYQWQSQTSANLSDMQGHPIVLNFWASWCVECHLEADLIENSWRKYQDQGVLFLGMAYADVEPKSIAYLEDFNISYPNAPDLGTDAAEKYEVTGVPETFFIDETGQIVYVHIGPLNQATLDGVLAEMLAEED